MTITKIILNNSGIAIKKKMNNARTAAIFKNHFGNRDVSTKLSSIPGLLGLNCFEIISPSTTHIARTFI